MKTPYLSAIMIVVCTVVGAVAPAVGGVVPYDIVYVRQPRYGDLVNTVWPGAGKPAQAEPGADLMLLHPDGSEEVLVAGGDGAVTDPFVSFDARWVYYAYFHNMLEENLNLSRVRLPKQGSDIFRIHLLTRQIEQLTFGEFTPNTGAGNWDESNPLDPPDEFNKLGYGVINLGPAPLAGGKIIFTSNRNALIPPRGFSLPTMQLYVMDEDGSNVTAIAPMSIGSALHPTPLKDGRVMFSSLEGQGVRTPRMWGLWSIYPDGRKWNPMLSSFDNGQTIHFATQLSDESIVATDYYHKVNNGFGAFLRFPISPPLGTPAFSPAARSENPKLTRTVDGPPESWTMSFSPWGLTSITPFTHNQDVAAPFTDGQWAGKVTHPTAAPDGDLLLVWTSGPANHKNVIQTPVYDGGLYLMPDGEEVSDPAALVLIKNDPNFNEAWPRPVVPYGDVHGVQEPAEIAWLPNDGFVHPELPAGTPFGLVGSSSLYKRESFPGFVIPDENSFDGLDAFNSDSGEQSSNWEWQGADAGKYTNSDIWALRVVAMEPNTHRSYGPNEGQQFASFASERLRILGEIPVRKPDGSGGEILDPEGNPDTSFLVKIPADTPYTFQTLDRNGMLLNMAQTWHQVRPGELRADCGGCHAHSQLPLDFETTAAAGAGYEIHDLSTTTPLLNIAGPGDPGLDIDPSPVVDVEFYRDIRPILQAKCVTCHTVNNPSPPGNLALDDLALYDGLPGDYKRLADDEDAQWGYPPLTDAGIWEQNNASRYIRKFQSRRSLLIWKVFGERLDGWSNSDHPTASVPGDRTTLPAGADPVEADIDYTGEQMPPPGNPPLTAGEKLKFVRWIDLGAPINSGEETGNGDFGWFLDDLRPTLTVSQPRPGLNTEQVTMLRVGVADANSGVDLSTLSIKADLSIEGRSPFAELADLAIETDPGIYVISLSQLLPPGGDYQLLAEVADFEGNFTRADVRFAIEDPSQVYRDLAVELIGSGAGTVSSNPPGILCGLDCDERYLDDTVVALQPTPGGESFFVGWTGDPDCSNGEVTLDTDLTCTAEFRLVPVLTVAVEALDAGANATGTVTSAPAGINCGADCDEAYAEGTIVNLVATADAGSLFIGWTGDADCLDGSLTMDLLHSCTAQFTLEHVLTMSLLGGGTGTVTSNPGGIDCGADCSEGYAEDTQVFLTATPDDDSYFSAWTGNTGCDDGVQEMTRDFGCNAVFFLKPVLELSLGGQGSGRVTSTPAGIDCGSDCDQHFDLGTVVTLTPIPDPGSYFDKWTGDAECSDGNGVLTMDVNRGCTARFAPLKDLTITILGTGGGTVTSAPGGIDCGADCTEGYLPDTVVTLTAIPAPGSVFDRWSGFADCLDGVVTMDQNENCNALFDGDPLLTVTKTGSGSGTVTSSPPGIDCGSDCLEPYTDNTAVTLSVLADPGSLFVGWSGDPSCGSTLVMNQSRGCTADFIQLGLTVTLSGDGAGTVTSSPAGIDCPGDCVESYSNGTVVDLEPTPDATSQFIGWLGDADCADGAVTVTTPLTCEAVFEPKPLLIVSKIGSGLGIVTSSPGGINCGADCQEFYDDGTAVSLTATASSGSVFSGWSGDPGCSTTLTLDQDRQCVAEFNALGAATLTVTLAGSGSGTVTTAPAGIDCPGDCSEDYAGGIPVTLTATAAAGSSFAGWLGNADCVDGVVTMDVAKSCQAVFDSAMIFADGFESGDIAAWSSFTGNN